MIEIQTKVLRVFLLEIHNPLYSFALRFIFLQTHSTSYSFYSLRKPYRNLKSENSQDYAQKRNCMFMNSASEYNFYPTLAKIHIKCEKRHKSFYCTLYTAYTIRDIMLNSEQLSTSTLITCPHHENSKGSDELCLLYLLLYCLPPPPPPPHEGPA